MSIQTPQAVEGKLFKNSILLNDPSIGHDNARNKRVGMMTSFLHDLFFFLL